MKTELRGIDRDSGEGNAKFVNGGRNSKFLGDFCKLTCDFFLLSIYCKQNHSIEGTLSRSLACDDYSNTV